MTCHGSTANAYTGMKFLRTAAFILMSLSPAAALAAATSGDCCPGPCCEHGCPFCNR